MSVPFLDLKAQYVALQTEIDTALQAVIDKTAFAGGPFVATFEREFAAYCESPHAVGVGSGTDALWFALLALGIGEGDEVITSPNTFIATVEAISFCGAQPVFVDVDSATYTLDPERFEKAITPRTRAVIPVHLFGQPADMDPILDIAERHGLSVIEDACQAHGARYRGRRAGCMGRVGCFSFYPGKNLGAFGEAGGVVTADPELADTVRMLRDHGQPEKYKHARVGWNGRMDGLQGAVLSVKLKHLDAANDARRLNACTYAELLKGVEGVACPFAAEYAEHVYHIYAVRVRERDRILSAMKESGIGCGIHYPIPLHLQEAYAGLGHREGDFPVCEAAAQEFMSLPMFPELTREQIAEVVDALKAVMAR